MPPHFYDTNRAIPITKPLSWRQATFQADFAVFLHALALVTRLGCETCVSRLGYLDVSYTWVTPEGTSRVSLNLEADLTWIDTQWDWRAKPCLLKVGRDGEDPGETYTNSILIKIGSRFQGYVRV